VVRVLHGACVVDLAFGGGGQQPRHSGKARRSAASVKIEF